MCVERGSNQIRIQGRIRSVIVFFVIIFFNIKYTAIYVYILTFTFWNRSLVEFITYIVRVHVRTS